MMIKSELSTLLSKLIDTWECEVVEFKQADNNLSTDKIGEYFSALANEANLRAVEKAWLIIGVNNDTRLVVGTNYRTEPERLQSLKMQIVENADPTITFRNIHELDTPAGRVILLEVPAAPCGMPIAWKGHYYARAGESLISLGLDKLDEIRQQTKETDWSAQIIVDATYDDLDQSAINKARESYALKYANRFPTDIVSKWPLATFLDRASLTRGGKITRTTLLLVGKTESAHLLSPYPAQITWKLEGVERAYEHFGLPFLLSTSALYQKIRNIQLRILPDDALIPVEVSKYDQKVVMEALHNCIAHQDYNRNGRIIVTELPDKLLFENEGSFFEGIPEDYIAGDKTPRRYRNTFLAQAMTELNMIDTLGYGIHEMHIGQIARYLPMPDYNLSESNVVRMTLYGTIVDPAYSRLLIKNTGLQLIDILALDRVQKKLSLPDNTIKRLRHAGLIEGRKPNFHVSASVAKNTASEADYIRTRAQDDAFYAKLVSDYLVKFGGATRQEIDGLLMVKLSDSLNDKQKYNKVSYILTNLRRSGRIRNTGTRKLPRWEIAEK